MKNYATIILIFYLLLPDYKVSSAIKNGYEVEKQKIEERIRNLHYYYTEQDTLKLKSKKIQRYLVKLSKQAREINRYFEATNSLLHKLKLIDFELYEKANHVKNKHGEITDIYVKIVKNIPVTCDEHYILFGYTNLAYLKEDLDTHTSKEFGVNTVCIYILNRATAILTLAHELGHALYQVENLRTYLNYYRSEYIDGYQHNYGHSYNDPSAFFVRHIENSFRIKYREYGKDNNLSPFVKVKDPDIEILKNLYHQ